MKRPLAALLCGALFGMGLTVAQMVNPDKVLAFLDITGQWDPSLALVMGGALLVTAVLLPRIRAAGRPVLGGRLYLSAAVGVDGRLVGGAGLFGIGWGLCGYCPGPAISALVLNPHEAFWVVGGMCAGFAVVHLALERPLATKMSRSDSKRTA
jgi:uncharacterized membrane protein YedE/YeeE